MGLRGGHVDVINLIICKGNKIVLLLICIVIGGCSQIYYLSDDYDYRDNHFISSIDSLDSAYKIGRYVNNEIGYSFNWLESAKSPYDVWNTGRGDCSDIATFAVYCAAFHNIEAYYMAMSFNGTLFTKHLIAILGANDGKYILISGDYVSKEFDKIQTIIDTQIDNSLYFYGWKCKSYRLYDVNYNKIDKY